VAGPRSLEVLFLPLTRDGRVEDPAALRKIGKLLPAVTDCFLFCHGWLYERADARREAARFFSLLDAALRPVGDRVVPLRIALHWPSRPLTPNVERGLPGDGVWPALVREAGDPARRESSQLARLLLDLCEAEVPLGPEEELELDGLLRRLREGEARGGVVLSPVDALSFWVMKRRAGEVGERLGREDLGALFAEIAGEAPRLHLIGHSFGAKLLASAVLGGARPGSLTLLLAAFSAFAFAPEVPGVGRPGFYHRILAERRVAGPIVALRSIHDRALATLYPAMTGSGQVDRRHPRGAGRHGNVREVVARSAMGAAGARGVGAPEVELLEVQRIGLPRRPVINVDGSRLVTANEWVVGAHRDIYHPEIATLVLLAAGLLQGDPDGARPRPLTAVSRS
jgi:hypothetical protein